MHFFFEVYTYLYFSGSIHLKWERSTNNPAKWYRHTSLAAWGSAWMNVAYLRSTLRTLPANIALESAESTLVPWVSFSALCMKTLSERGSVQREWASCKQYWVDIWGEPIQGFLLYRWDFIRHVDLGVHLLLSTCKRGSWVVEEGVSGQPLGDLSYSGLYRVRGHAVIWRCLQELRIHSSASTQYFRGYRIVIFWQAR